MLKIVALNESEEEDLGEEIEVTKEAQEAIAESEYMRAMRLKHGGNLDFALSLLMDLLETKVLSEDFLDKKNDKLCAMRYNCYKNIAFIFEEKKEFRKALQNYIFATKLDEKDVYTMSRFGQLALKTNSIETADYAFENCLRRNPLHWVAADGMLQLLCQNCNVIGAYCWALKILSKDNVYPRALDVVSEVSSMFSDTLPFYDAICPTPKPKFNVRSNFSTVLAKSGPVKEETIDATYKPTNLSHLRLEEINWLSIGNQIIYIYNNLKKTNTKMMFLLDFDIFQKADDFEKQNIICSDTDDVDATEKEPSSETCTNTANADGTQKTETAGAETTEQVTCETNNISVVENENVTPFQQSESTNEMNENVDNSKPKSRRRCSDLHFLEQWGWHKNRRYSSRKKNQPEKVEVDTSLKGYLEKVFCKHMEKSYEETWPFNENLNDGKNIIDTSMNNSDKKFSIHKFQEETQIGFNKFFAELKSSNFDLMSLICKWLEFVSVYWTLPFPEELKTTYISVFEIYMEHFDFASWNQFSRRNLVVSYIICLLFLELEYERVVHTQGHISSFWKSLLSHLKYYSGYDYIIADENYNINLIRLVNMEYCSTKYENNLIKSVHCLEHLEYLIGQNASNFVLELPNLTGSAICKEVVKFTRDDLLRKIKLNKIPKLFEEQKWSDLVDIIKDNLKHSSNLNSCEYWIRDVKTQFEVLLQALWNMCDVNNCLIWSEKCFAFVVGKYLSGADNRYTQNTWAESINYVLSYIESSIFYEGYEILNCLDENLSRLIQNLTRLLSFHLDGPFDKHSNTSPDIDMKSPWVILHQILLREECNNPVMIRPKQVDVDAEDVEDLIPQSFLILFTAHEFLGKRQWCTRDNGMLLLYILDVTTPNLRAPLFDAFRDIVYEYLEQITYCLYNFPPKKARSRHIEEHESTPIEVTCTRGLQLFDLYKPKCLPEFNSYKLESITAEMEQLLLKIVCLMSSQIDTTPAIAKIMQFISGEVDQLPDESDCIKLPYKISTIYYLLADYYFKNRDFSKTLKYYTLDLACNPLRLDSWAGISLSKASKIETKLNDFQPIDISSFLTECEDTIRCFEQCIKLDQSHTLLWIEYGSFCYTIHSFCSRHLKRLAHKMSAEELTFVEGKKEKMLNKGYNCFTLAANLQNNTADSEAVDNDESHEEKWLCQYMLGKIAEKRQEKPKVYLNYYLTAAHYLYESSATYPIKINHSNPTPLSVEALEVFYRTNSAIIKYLERKKNIERETGSYFKKVLKNLSSSPFAFNKAKIDGSSLNVLKRKITNKSEDNSSTKMPKLVIEQEASAPTNTDEQLESNLLKTATEPCLNKTDKTEESNDEKGSRRMSADSIISRKSTSSRRNSNESSTAGSSTTESATSSTSTSTSSSETSSTGSESDNDSDNTEKRNYSSEDELLYFYESAVKNLEECATRFPEHYKSIYRLVYHYMNAPEKLRDLDRCEQLLLGQYITKLGNQVNGIFFDRKSSNIFNGIWRLPSSEVDRPGSFSTHLVKCIAILIQMLKKQNNYKLLIDIALQLYKVPDNDKRYIRDMERIELYQQAINFCVEIMRNIFKANSTVRNDNEILTLLIDTYKTHKKCVKHLNHKEPLFSQLLIEVYKYYIEDKIEKIPDNLNFLDLAIKLCLQEISARKNQEKVLSDPSNAPNLSDTVLGITNLPQSTATTAPIHIPGLLMKTKNRANVAKFNPNSNLYSTEAAAGSLIKREFSKEHLNYPSSTALMNPFSIKPATDPDAFQKLVAEYYKLFGGGDQLQMPPTMQQKSIFPQIPLSITSALPTETTITQLSSFTDKNQVMCTKSITSLTSDSTNYARSEPSTSAPSYTGFSTIANNPLSLFTPHTSMAELTDLTHFASSLYSSANTKDLLSTSILYKTLADKADFKPEMFLPKQDQMIKPPKNPSLLRFAENMFNPEYKGLQENVKAKAPVTKAKKQKTFMPYSLPSTKPQPNSGIDLLVNTSSNPLLNALDTKHISQSTNFLAAYTDLIKNAQSMAQQASLSQAGGQKQTLPKQIAKSKPVFDVSEEAQKNLPTFLPSPKTQQSFNDGTSTINMSSFNLHTSIMPSYKTPLQQTAGTSSETSLLKSSPKTLQQKLAERQRVSQQNDANDIPPPTSKPPNVDVIILD